MRHLRHQLKIVVFRVVCKCPQKQLETLELPCSITRRLAMFLINTTTPVRLLVLTMAAQSHTSGDDVKAVYHVCLHH